MLTGIHINKIFGIFFHKVEISEHSCLVEFFEDEELDENSAISRRLFPEKQALTVSEIAQLLESDTLDKSVQEEHENEQQENSPN